MGTLKWEKAGDVDKNFQLMKDAADQGDYDAMAFILNSERLSIQQRHDYLITAALHKNYVAQSRLMELYGQGSAYYNIPKDYKKKIYWAQRASCDHTSQPVSHIYLGALYSDIPVEISPQEKLLVQKNLPLAYAHILITDSGFPGHMPELDTIEQSMTDEQMKQGELIVRIFKSGGCPYDN